MRYLSLDTELTSAGSAGFAAYSRRQGASRLLNASEAAILATCATPRSLDEHVEQIVRRLPAGPDRAQAQGSGTAPAPASPAERVRSSLSRLIDAGLLVGEADALAPLGMPAPGPECEELRRRIASVCIPTRNRPRRLRRALTSYLEQDLRYGRSTEFIVVDDSDDPALSVRTLRVAREVGAAAGRAVRYADRRDRLAYASELAAVAGLPAELVRFGLIGEAGGARNTILLDTLGTSYLQADDDTVGIVFRPPRSEDGVRLTSEGDANEHWYFPDLRAAVAAGEPVEIDLLDLHEQVLGRSVRSLASAAQGPLTIGAAVSPRCLSDATLPGARVAVSYLGTVGHCGGLGLPQYRLKVAGPSFDRLVCDEMAFEANYHSMQMIRCAPRLTLADVDYCVTANMAVDNRSPLPPYPPVGACEDTLFGIVRGAMCAPAYVAFLPYAVLHDAGTARPSEATPPLTTRMNDIVIELTRHFLGIWPGRGDAGLLTGLGEFFGRVAALEPRGFADYIRRLEHARIAANIRYLDHLPRTRYPAPEFWRARVRAYRDEWRSLLLDPDRASPSDLPGPPAERQARFQRVLGDYGALLRRWPAIRAAAEELHARGRRLSRELR